MATYEVVLSQRLNGVLCQMTFNYNKLTSPAGVVGAPAQIAAAFGDLVLPNIMALQSNLVTNESVRCRDLGAPATAATLEAGGGGSLAVAASGTMPPHLPLLLLFTATNWIDVETNTPYVGVRPGGRGKKYLSGVTEDWNLSTGAAVPVALATAWNDLQVAFSLALAVPVLSGTVDPVVYSPAKGVLGELPARNALVAEITDTQYGEFTRLESRKS